jgi:hypothetical protein
LRKLQRENRGVFPHQRPFEIVKGETKMKHGKKPTVRQGRFIQKNSLLDFRDWFVVKDTASEMLLVHREDARSTVRLYKGGM